MFLENTKAGAPDASNLIQQHVSDTCEPTPLAVGNVQPTSEQHATGVGDTTTTTRLVTITALDEFLDGISETLLDIRKGLGQIIHPMPDFLKADAYTNLEDVEQGIVDVICEVAEFSGEGDGVTLVLATEPAQFERLHDALETMNEVTCGALAHALDLVTHAPDADDLQTIKKVIFECQGELGAAMADIKDFISGMASAAEPDAELWDDL